MSKSPLDPREALANLATETKLIFARRQALVELIEQTTHELIFSTQYVGDESDPLNVSNQKASVLRISADLGQRLSGLKAALEVVEESSAHKSAADEVKPLLDAVAALEQKELQDRIALDKKRAQLRDALEKATSAAESHPDVLAARNALAAIA